MGEPATTMLYSIGRPNPLEESAVPSLIGDPKNTPIAIRWIVLIFVALVSAGVVYAFVPSVVLQAEGYATGISAHKHSHEVIVHFGSSSPAAVDWEPDVVFEDRVYAYQVQGQNSHIQTLMAIKLWLANQTTSNPTVYYTVNAVVDSLFRDVANAVETVQPVQLAEYLATMFKKRHALYVSEFVEYLALLNSQIIGLQNATNQMLADNICRGKPFESTTFALLGSQTLSSGIQTPVTWGSSIQQPTSVPLLDFSVTSGTNITTLLHGAYAATVLASFVVPANSSGSTTLVLTVNGTPAALSICQQDQIDTGGPTVVQCQFTTVQQLLLGNVLSLSATASVAGVTLTSTNTRLIVERVC